MTKKRPFLRVLLLAWTLAAAPLAIAKMPANVDLDLSKYAGSVIVVDFWASWCVPCRRSFPWLNQMAEKYADDGLVVIGVNVDRDPASAEEFLEEYPATFQIYYDSNGILAKQFDVQAMPSSFVIGRDGEIKNHHLGFKVKRQDEYEAAIVAQIGQGRVE